MKKKDRYIFSGDNSADFWKAINKADSKRKLREVLYWMGCKCQELEAEVRKLSDKN